MIVVLDNIRSAHNVGSIFRTADAFGVEKIYLCGVTPGPLDRFDRLNTKVTKVSLGAEKTVSWEHSTDPLSVIVRLQAEGYRIVALEQHPHAKGLKSVALRLRRVVLLALVLGTEVEGLPAGVLERADEIVEIPMLGKKESLNVSVAFGIAAYALGGGPKR